MAYTFPYVPLNTNYADDVIDTNTNSNVVYIMTDLADSSTKNITLQDATVYTSLGDSLDANVINETNSTVNAIANAVNNNYDDIQINAAAIAVLQDGKIDIDTTASPGTTDGDLYAAITALGWASDVIE